MSQNDRDDLFSSLCPQLRTNLQKTKGALNNDDRPTHCMAAVLSTVFALKHFYLETPSEFERRVAYLTAVLAFLERNARDIENGRLALIVTASREASLRIRSLFNALAAGLLTQARPLSYGRPGPRAFIGTAAELEEAMSQTQAAVRFLILDDAPAILANEEAARGVQRLSARLGIASALGACASIRSSAAASFVNALIRTPAVRIGEPHMIRMPDVNEVCFYMQQTERPCFVQEAVLEPRLRLRRVLVAGTPQMTRVFRTMWSEVCAVRGRTIPICGVRRRDGEDGMAEAVSMLRSGERRVMVVCFELCRDMQIDPGFYDAVFLLNPPTPELYEKFLEMTFCEPNPAEPRFSRIFLLGRSVSDISAFNDLAAKLGREWPLENPVNRLPCPLFDRLPPVAKNTRSVLEGRCAERALYRLHLEENWHRLSGGECEDIENRLQAKRREAEVRAAAAGGKSVPQQVTSFEPITLALQQRAFHMAFLHKNATPQERGIRIGFPPIHQPSKPAAGKLADEDRRVLSTEAAPLAASDGCPREAEEARRMEAANEEQKKQASLRHVLEAFSYAAGPAVDPAAAVQGEMHVVGGLPYEGWRNKSAQGGVFEAGGAAPDVSEASLSCELSASAAIHGASALPLEVASAERPASESDENTDSKQEAASPEVVEQDAALEAAASLKVPPSKPSDEAGSLFIGEELADAPEVQAELPEENKAIVEKALPLEEDASEAPAEDATAEAPESGEGTHEELSPEDEQDGWDEDEDEEESLDDLEAEEARDGEAYPVRRTLTIRSGYVPHAHAAPEITITEPLSSSTVALRNAQARERRAMRGTDEPLTHQMMGKNGRRRFVKKKPQDDIYAPTEGEDSILGSLTLKPSKGHPHAAKGYKKGLAQKGSGGSRRKPSSLRMQHRNPLDAMPMAESQREALATEGEEQSVHQPKLKMKKKQLRQKVQKKKASAFEHEERTPQLSRAALAGGDTSPEALEQLSDELSGSMSEMRSGKPHQKAGVKPHRGRLQKSRWREEPARDVSSASDADAMPADEARTESPTTQSRTKKSFSKRMRRPKESFAAVRDASAQPQPGSAEEDTLAADSPLQPHDRTSARPQLKGGNKMRRAKKTHAAFRQPEDPMLRAQGAAAEGILARADDRSSRLGDEDDNFGNSIHYRPKQGAASQSFGISGLTAAGWQPQDPYDYRAQALTLPQRMPGDSDPNRMSIFGASSQPGMKIHQKPGKGGKGKPKSNQSKRGPEGQHFGHKGPYGRRRFNKKRGGQTGGSEP